MEGIWYSFATDAKYVVCGSVHGCVASSILLQVSGTEILAWKTEMKFPKTQLANPTIF